ncbi:hypothetical protein G7054_g8692 [Neopestalotiopsis clavispora]|nr:hypothetical protein G7054_g8692 [Neopestalotiopsis clavispora]
MTTATHSGINLLIWIVVFTVLDVLFVLLRFWAARLIHRQLSADDYLIIFALANVLALEGVLIWSIFYGGIGRYSTELLPTELAIALKAIPAAYVTWTLGTAAFKLSVLFFYTRIFSTKTFRIITYALMGLTVAYCLTFMVVFFTTCTPDISQLWNPRPDGHCRDLNIGQLGSVSTNLAIDLLLIALPMPFLWNLKMALRNKISVTLVFSLGFITIAIMIWRIVDLVTKKDEDFVKNTPILALTTTLELWLCIIIACIPTLAPLFKTYISPMLSKMTGSQPSKNSGRRPMVTFGRSGASDRKRYANISGSQDLTYDDPEAGQAAFRNDAFTTSHASSNFHGEWELETTSTARDAIRVQKDIATSQAPRE